MLESTAETTPETTATSPIVAHSARPGFRWRELPEGARLSVDPGDGQRNVSNTKRPIGRRRRQALTPSDTAPGVKVRTPAREAVQVHPGSRSGASSLTISSPAAAALPKASSMWTTFSQPRLRISETTTDAR